MIVVVTIVVTCLILAGMILAAHKYSEFWTQRLLSQPVHDVEHILLYGTPPPGWIGFKEQRLLKKIRSGNRAAEEAYKIYSVNRLYKLIQICEHMPVFDEEVKPYIINQLADMQKRWCELPYGH